MKQVRKYRQSIKGVASFTGITVHSGKIVTMTISPAPCNTGIQFLRTDIKNPDYIKVDYKNVTDTKLCTRISNQQQNQHISTIEHIISALYMCEVDDAIIHINGDEVPIVDGSALDFTKLISAIGVITFDEPLKYIKIKEKIELINSNNSISITPYDNFELTASISFDNPDIKQQTRTFNCTDNQLDYLKNIAPARTFGFIQDIQLLKQNGLAQGGRKNNAIVFDENGAQNSMRFKDECIRHKILDIIGDLALSPYPILGKITANKMGHALNNDLLHAIFNQQTSFEIISK